MPLASYSNLLSTLLSNVVMLQFARRRRLPGLPSVRRMLCTNCSALLNSTNGKIVLNYRAPTKAPRYNPTNENLIITWDIIMQDYRNVTLDTCSIEKVLPANDEFWKYFNETILPMSTAQKIAFMAT